MVDAARGRALLLGEGASPRVALVQPSSAEVERLFSQLKLIVGQIGVSGLEEGYKARTMTRVNGIL